MESTFFLPTIGQLRVDRILLSYDGPKVFVSKALTDSLYLSYWAAELGALDRWWFIPISEQRLQQIEQARISLRDAIITAESGFVVETEWPDDATEPSSLKYVAAASIPAEALPGPDSFLRMRQREAISLAAQIPAFVMAAQQQRPVVRLRVLTKGKEALVARVAAVMNCLQGTLDAFGQALAGQASERGMIAQGVLDQTALSLSAVYSGSVGLELVGEQLQLLPSSLLMESISRLDAVLKESGNLAALRQYFAGLQKRSVTRFKNFLESIVDIESDVEMSFASPQAKGDTVSLLRQVEVAQALESLYREELRDSQTEVVIGELIGMNKRTKRFELREVGTDRKIVGRILQSAMDAARWSTLSNIYDATVVSTEEYQPLTEAETRRYELLGLSEHGEPRKDNPNDPTLTWWGETTTHEES